MENEFLQQLLDSYDDSAYPEPFLKRFQIMECLAERNGIITFLVRDSDGQDRIAKCFDKQIWSFSGGDDLLVTLDHPGLPKHIASYENEKMTVTVREYMTGTPLSRYAEENELTEQEIVRICTGLCDILAYLHHRTPPVIHRDIKPDNVIIRPDGSVALIDFDIARVYKKDRETDTTFFGTLAYAPPEQYGFSQTDARTDIYSLGILLRWLLTGSVKDNANVRVSRPLSKVIRKCTAFSPKERFSDVSQVKKALRMANPAAQRLRTVWISLAGVIAAGLLIFAGIMVYRAATYSPFSAGSYGGYLPEEESILNAVAYIKQKYHTDLFDHPEEKATVGLLRKALIEFYHLDPEYVNRINPGRPEESDDFFLPWDFENDHPLPRDVVVYAAVKVHDPAIVKDLSSLKDDNGYYPGLRVAVAFAERNGILEGANQPEDIPVGEMALILANAERVFEAEK